MSLARVELGFEPLQLGPEYVAQRPLGLCKHTLTPPPAHMHTRSQHSCTHKHTRSYVLALPEALHPCESWCKEAREYLPSRSLSGEAGTLVSLFKTKTAPKRSSSSPASGREHQLLWPHRPLGSPHDLGMQVGCVPPVQGREARLESSRQWWAGSPRVQTASVGSKAGPGRHHRLLQWP